MNRMRDNWIQSWVSSAREIIKRCCFCCDIPPLFRFFIYTNNLRHRVSTCLYASGKREEFPSSPVFQQPHEYHYHNFTRENTFKKTPFSIFFKDVMEGSLIRFNHNNAGSYSALVFDSTRAQLIVAARYSNNSHYCVCLSIMICIFLKNTIKKKCL